MEPLHTRVGPTGGLTALGAAAERLTSAMAAVCPRRRFDYRAPDGTVQSRVTDGASSPPADLPNLCRCAVLAARENPTSAGAPPPSPGPASVPPKHAL